MEKNPRIAEILLSIRQTSIFRELIPQEAGVGWPIPVRKSGVVYVTIPFYGLEYDKEKSQTKLFPPFAALTSTWPQQVPVEYINLRFRNPWPEGQWEGLAGTFPYPAIAHLSKGEYEQKRKQLLEMYDEMLVTLAQNSQFSPQWTTSFRNLLRLLMEPGLEPFYRALAPKFFDHFLLK